MPTSGLVRASSNASGPGRPSNRWCLTDEGRAQFPDGSGRFALGLLDSMRSHLPEATVRQLLNQQAESKASQYRRKASAKPPWRLDSNTWHGCAATRATSRSATGTTTA